MSCISPTDAQMARLADAIEQRVGAQRFRVWFNSSTRLDLKADGLEIAVANDFIGEWIAGHYVQSIRDAAADVLGGTLAVRFNVVPELFKAELADGADEHAGDRVDAGQRHRGNGNGHGSGHANGNGNGHANGHSNGNGRAKEHAENGACGNGSGMGAVERVGEAVARAVTAEAARHDANGRAGGKNGCVKTNGDLAGLAAGFVAAGVDGRSNGLKSAAAAMMPGASSPRGRLRHGLDTFVTGPGNQIAYGTAVHVADNPGAQYNPLFIHGGCGLGKTHLLQGLCKRFIERHPTRRWMYLTGEEFTNEFLAAMRSNRLDGFRRKVRELDLLVIDDVHFMGGKRATQDEFLHTFNAIEAMGRQVVMASDNHPKMIQEFGESLVNRFVSGMVVRIDPPNYATRCEILRAMCNRAVLGLDEEVIGWIARRVTQSVRELEGAVTRIHAQMRLTGRTADLAMVQDGLSDLDRQHGAPVRPENIVQSVCAYFGLEHKDLMSNRRQRTISLARSVAMYLVRKMVKLSFPEIGSRLGKRNHSTVISACRRIEKAVQANDALIWTSAVGERSEEATELVQRLEEQSRALA